MAKQDEGRSESVVLRSLEPGDVERTHRWHNSPALYEFLASPFRHVSRTTEEEWLARRIAYSTSEVNLAICVRETSQHIGNIYLRDIDPVARHGEIHLFIGEPQSRGKGYGSSAIRQMVHHGLGDLNLQRIHLKVLASNEPAIHAYTRCGFEIEGTLRRHALKSGEPVDVIVMGLLHP